MAWEWRTELEIDKEGIYVEYDNKRSIPLEKILKCIFIVIKYKLYTLLYTPFDRLSLLYKQA